MSNKLFACILAALGGVSQKKSEFYMSSILIDRILCTQAFPALKCNWEKDRTPVYTAYKLLWAHKYHSYYREICEHFIMPLYTLIFLTECNCMSVEAFKVIQEFGDYYLMEDGLYVRMYGGSRAPSLLLKYATDYVLHKEAVRQLYIDGVGNFLFQHKKEMYPTVRFLLGSYNFSRVKQATEFVKELEYFRFGEMNFHRNDSHNKVANLLQRSRNPF